ncbi:MAG: PEGA domain-containing protein [Myxococcota bacterium]
MKKEKQVLGCESDTNCLAEIGGALGVALLVSGSVGKVGSRYIISLSLTDTATVKVLAREQRQVLSADALTSEMERAARYLVRDLLAGHQGTLIVRASESDADVEIDGRIVGVTPLGRQTLSGGPHRIKLIKTGFITWASDVEIVKNTPLVVDASMVPSIEFINAYEARAGTWRTLAFITGGVGLAAAGFGVAGWAWNGGRADDLRRDVEAANCHAGAEGVALQTCSGFDSRRDAIGRWDIISQAAGWAGLVSLGVGLYLFFAGPNPTAYDQYKPGAGIQVDLDVVPISGDGAVVGTLVY